MEDKDLNNEIKKALKNVDDTMDYVSSLSGIAKKLSEANMSDEVRAKVQAQLGVTSLSDVFADIGKAVKDVSDIRKNYNL